MTVSPTAAPDHVKDAIAVAARKSGADFSYLLATAQRESGFDPQARAPTSSAAGLFQFIEQTWLGVMKRHGGQYGLQSAADQITQGQDGRYGVADPAARQRILDLRMDENIAAAMAGELTAESAQQLSGRLGRTPTPAELYAAHFLGAGGAAKLIQAAETDPGARADALFPAAARANRAIFAENGKPASVSQVLAKLGAHHGAAAPADGAPVHSGSPAPDAQWRAPAIVFAANDTDSQRVRWAPPSSAGRVLSPLVIEALAALDTPGGTRRDA